jgi:hypothetical protein
MGSPTQRSLKHLRSQGYTADVAERVCPVPGCGRSVRRDNRSGYCRDHHGLSPQAKARDAAYLEANRAVLSERRRERAGYKSRYRWGPCSADGCQERIRTKDNESGLCRHHRKLAWAKAKYEPIGAADRRLRDAYGITLAEKVALLEAQGGRCAVCGTSEPRGRRRDWQLDHDHATGAIRGVLCSPCNLGIGMLGDTADRLRAALQYLEAKR